MVVAGRMKIYRAQETADGRRQTADGDNDGDTRAAQRVGEGRDQEGGRRRRPSVDRGPGPRDPDEQRREHKPCLPGVPGVDLSHQEVCFLPHSILPSPSPPRRGAQLEPARPPPPFPFPAFPFPDPPTNTSAVRRLGPTHNRRHTVATSLTFSCIENLARNGEEQLTQFLSICPVLRRNSTHWHVLSFDSTRPPTATRQILSRRNTIARLPRWCVMLAHFSTVAASVLPQHTRDPSSHQNRPRRTADKLADWLRNHQHLPMQYKGN